MSSVSSSFADGALTLAFDEDDDNIAFLTLDRPGSRNAIALPTWKALPQAIAAVAARADTRVLVLRGAAGDFAAGADIAEFATVFAERTATLHYADAMIAAVNALAACPTPSIAMIDGHCIGAGVALALACDIRCAAADARFGVTPSRLGLLYPLGDTRRLVRAIGASKAADLLFTGRLFGAPEALSMQLIDELHEPSALHQAVLTKARTIAAQSAWSVRHAKSVLALIADGAVADTDTTRGWFADAVETADHHDRRRAFSQRRRGSARTS